MSYKATLLVDTWVKAADTAATGMAGAGTATASTVAVSTAAASTAAASKVGSNAMGVGRGAGGQRSGWCGGGGLLDGVGGRNRGWRAAKSGAAETRAAEASDVETRRSSGGIQQGFAASHLLQESWCLPADVAGVALKPED
eukprot:scaffold34527_cov36-Phaeocystis_antarctica.AAC.3